MRLAVAVVDGTSSNEPLRSWVRDDVPLIVISASDPVALARWADSRPATHVAVLTRPDTGSSARLLTTVAAGRHPDIAFCVLERDASLLALAVCAMAALERQTEPVDSIAQLQSLLATTDSGVWLKRVNKLRSPQPRFVQHLRSMLPGGQGYLATMTPESTVVAAKNADGSIPPRDGHFVSEVVSDIAVREVFHEVFGTDASSLPPVGSTELRYGSPGVEYARLGRRDALPTRSCPVCSIHAAGDVCPFCRARLDHESQENE